jgi:predicted alpha/beta-fold hydrolase
MGERGKQRVYGRVILRFAAGLLAWLGVLSGPASATYLGAYDYPFVNPFLATVVGTPPPYQAALPEIEPARDAWLLKARPFPDRRLPAVLWYNDGLEYALFSRNSGPAPLVFVIAGTGGGFAASKSIVLVRTMLEAGFHVVSLPNPTHPNFIATASTSSVPGDLGEDARDLYRVMRLVLPEVRKRVEVSAFYLTGFSLGAAHAAYVAQLDAAEHAIGFSKVLLVHPPVNLYVSMRRLDDYLDRYLAADPLAVSRFIEQTFEGLTRVYSTSERAEFTGDFLYRTFLTLQPDAADLERLVGLAFRLTANDMAFTSDVMTRAGYVVPPDARLGATTSLTPFLEQGLGLSFQDYFEGIFLPYYTRRHPDRTRSEILDRAGLAAIRDFLGTSPQIGVVTAEDDIILAPGEVRFFEGVFGARARIFPTGGHGGSMEQRDVVAEIIRFFRE